jgi:beta-lactamase regulating signal transducer with metallopeptidase domain
VAPLAPVAPSAEVQARQHVEVLRSSGSNTVIVERRSAAPFAVAEPSPRPFVAAEAPAGAGFDWQSWVLFAWLAGVAVVALRWLFGVIGAWRLVQHAEPVYDLDWLELKERIAFGMDLDRPVRLLRSDRVSVPIAGGIFDPVVVLPSEADAWDDERREVVLTHELAHIVRWDCLTQTVAQGAAAIHWFNPLVWIGYRRFMLEREHACDDFVLNHGTRASDYAHHLVQIARRFRRARWSLDATAPMARRSNLEGRILSILDPEQNRQSATLPRLAMLGVLTFALVGPLAAFHPVEGEPRAMQTASIYELPALPSVSVVAPRLTSKDDTFTWEGRVGSGGFVEVYGVNGSIGARTGSGDRVRVEAEKKSRRGQEDEVEIVVQEFANGVVICAIYPGQRDDCEPGEGTSGDVRDNDVQVAFEIVLPADVRFSGNTVNGSIKTETLGGDVEARTVNGSIRTGSRNGDVTAKTVNGSVTAEAGGLVRAHTVNGSITARVGQTEWERGMGFETTNGSITVELPDAFNADIRARARSGSIRSDFPLRIERNSYVGSQASGELGDGGAELQLDVLNGSIKLLRTSGSFGSRHDDARRNEELNREQIEREMRAVEREMRAAEGEMALVEQALAEIGPTMELAMAEAGRAMAEIDFEREVARAMDSVNWNEIQREIDRAMAEASIEVEMAFEEARHDRAEAWRDAESDIEDALDDVRERLADVKDERAELEQEASRLSGRDRSEVRAAQDRLRIIESALEEAERGLERVLCNAHEQHGDDCPDQ